MNVAGRGEPLTFERCIEVAQAKLVRLPGKMAFRLALKILWQIGNCLDSARGRALHDRRIHHEHRSAAESFWARIMRT